MTKQWETKRKVLDLLIEKKRTLTDISRLLGIAPATASQHLKELRGMGAVQEAEEQFSAKWRYYEANKIFYERVIVPQGGDKLKRVLAAIE